MGIGVLADHAEEDILFGADVNLQAIQMWVGL